MIDGTSQIAESWETAIDISCQITEGWESPVQVIGPVLSSPDKVVAGESIEATLSISDASGSVAGSVAGFESALELVEDGDVVQRAQGQTDSSGLLSVRFDPVSSGRYVVRTRVEALTEQIAETWETAIGGSVG